MAEAIDLDNDCSAISRVQQAVADGLRVAEIFDLMGGFQG